jgi:excisionase family DNA binding protein
MRKLMGTRSPETDPPRFHSVAETAQIFGVSEMTMYRAIHERRFPAVRIMGRLVVPAKAIDLIVGAAIESNSLVDTAEWVPEFGPDLAASHRDAIDRRERDFEGRPRPGANQTGAGSPVTQQGARGEVSRMTDPDSTDREGRSYAVGGVR